MTITLRDLYTFEEVDDFGSNRKGILRTWVDVCEEVIETLGDYADDFNVDAIAADCYTLAAFVDNDGTQYGDAFFAQVVDARGFWESVESHDIS